MIICQYGFIFSNKCTSLASEVDNGIGYACVGWRVYGKSLYLPLNFVVNLKLLLKSLYKNEAIDYSSLELQGQTEMEIGV